VRPSNKQIASCSKSVSVLIF